MTTRRATRWCARSTTTLRWAFESCHLSQDRTETQPHCAAMDSFVRLGRAVGRSNGLRPLLPLGVPGSTKRAFRDYGWSV